MVPFAAFSHFRPGHTPLAVNHQGLFVASTISYNLLPGASLGDAATEIWAAMKVLHAPATAACKEPPAYSKSLCRMSSC